MSEQSLTLVAGVLFLLIAVVGGGFTIERLQIPKVPGSARVASSVLGVLLIGLFVYSSIAGPVTLDAADTPTPTPSGSVAPPAADDLTFAESGPFRSSDGIEVSEIAVTGPDPLVVDDRISMSYRLRNSGDSAVDLASTFIGVRFHPGDVNRDKEVDPPTTLPPGAELAVTTTLVLDEAGTWTVWPCYILTDGTYCPDEWRAFSLPVAAP
jgi:hypothetical protein